MKIFILEDDETLGFGMKRYLEDNSYEVLHVKTLKEAKDKFNYDFDLIILDVNLPDGSGFDFLSLFEIDKTPIMFLTVNDSEEDIIKGLNMSDEYITKPFKLSILKARIESLLRRVDSKDNKLNYEGLVVDEKNFKTTVDGRDIDLTLKEFELLKYLMINRGNILTRDKILSEVWDKEGYFVEDNTLSATIKRLRKKLGKYSYTIETIRGIGYRFVRD